MGSAFLDADVILDLFIRREPHHAEALWLFSRLRRAEFRCGTSPLVIANVHYVLCRIKTKRYALGRIGRLRKLVGIATITEAKSTRQSYPHTGTSRTAFSTTAHLPPDSTH